jgi:hypothetical protein
LVAGMKMNIDSGTADVVSAVIHQQGDHPKFCVNLWNGVE